MSTPITTTTYREYVDLQNYLGTAPDASGSIYLSGSAASEKLYTNVGLDVAGASEFEGAVTSTSLSASGDIDCGDLLARTLEIDSMAANWTNASRTVADMGTVTTMDLNGGTIDGTTIGGSSVAAGSFAALVGTTATFSSTLTANGDVDLGNATSDTVTVTGRFDSDLVPSSDSARDLGTSALQWAEVHADAGYIDAITVTGTSTLTTVDINGGAIDGATIGANSAGAANFTTVEASGDATFNGNIVGDNSTNVSGISQLTASYAKIDILDVNEINSVTRTETTLEVVDKLLLAGSGSASAAAADGGLQIGGTHGADTVASILYDHANTALDFNIGGTTEVRLTDGALLPQADSDVDLGSSALQFKDVHADAGYIDAITVTGTSTLTTVDINGGAIDGTAIGANSAAAGTFAAVVATSLNCSDGSITNVNDIALDSISADDGSSFSMGSNWTNASRTVADMGTVTTMDLNGGSIDGTTIGAAAAGAGTFTTLIGATVSGSGAVSGGSLTARTLDIDSFAANWTNASRTVADMGTVTTMDLNGGSIDGTTIGANSAAAGTFAALVGTTATFSSTLTANGDVDLGNATSDTVTVTGRFDSDLVPSSDSARDLGTSALQWADIHADAGYIDAITVTGTSTLTTVDINGGAVDAVTIGSNSACTALTVNGANAHSITSTGANNVSLTAGNNLVFDAQGTDEDDGFIFNLGTDNDSTLLTIKNNSGTELYSFGGDGTFEHNLNNQAAADFVFHGNTNTDKITYDAGENAFIVYDGDSETVRLGGDATSDYALDVKDGSNNINKVRAAAFVTYSDERLKTDVKPMNNALNTVNSLKAVNFTWKKDGVQDFGFLAQELKKVIPQAVHGADEGLYGVDYGRLTSVLVGAIQEQSAQIKALQEKLGK